MVTAHPLPEGFTEIEVFAIGTALLVEGKFSVDLGSSKIFFFLLFLMRGGKEYWSEQQHLWYGLTLVPVATSPVLLVSKSGRAAGSLLWRSALYA